MDSPSEEQKNRMQLADLTNMKFKAVIFDLDGTLVDSIEDIAHAMNTVLKQQGFPIHTVAKYKQFVGSGLRNLTSKVLPKENQTENLIQSTFDAMFDFYSKNCVRKTKPYDGIQELLDELVARKIKIAVFSNKADALTKKIVTTIFPEISFEDIVGLTVEALKKPNPFEAIRISEKMKISSGQIIYVGDSGVDMQTAHNAGMFPVGVSWGYRSEEDLLTNGAQNIVHHPLELLKIIIKK